MNHLKNVGYSIASFLLIFLVFAIAGISSDSQTWVQILLLLLIYFEIWNIKKEKK